MGRCPPRRAGPQQAGLARQTWNAAPVTPTAIVVPTDEAPSLLAEANELASAPETPAPAPAETVAAPVAVAKAATPAAKPVATAAKRVAAVAKPAVAAKAPEVAKAAPAAAAFSTTINAPTGRYYIVGGSFRTLAAAQGQRQALAKLGHRSRVVLPRFSGHKIKVSIDDYADKLTAEREAQRMRTQTHLGKDLWVLAN
ncbi:SPOR domain-containing protein [Hymenobacter coccineus]|uniref:SPOR domain-containing protein n=1 Tax=Hymenobacter coccineus TaxID=1908235 RepID=A0A1G1TH34_9BACT|nr:SPOR domain-containing protein [Hymenobacter coccineus]OGX90194.1 hypothetical protein BEN49_23610 [Hymenobacter coccineus]